MRHNYDTFSPIHIGEEVSCTVLDISSKSGFKEGFIGFNEVDTVLTINLYTITITRYIKCDSLGVNDDDDDDDDDDVYQRILHLNLSYVDRYLNISSIEAESIIQDALQKHAKFSTYKAWFYRSCNILRLYHSLGKDIFDMVNKIDRHCLSLEYLGIEPVIRAYFYTGDLILSELLILGWSLIITTIVTGFCFIQYYIGKHSSIKKDSVI